MIDLISDNDDDNHPTMPHCDPRILHAPGECEYCDERPDWQKLRQIWGIAFTGKEPSTKEPGRQELPCPADFNRGISHRKWGGNQARPKEEEKARLAVWKVMLCAGLPLTPEINSLWLVAVEEVSKLVPQEVVETDVDYRTRLCKMIKDGRYK